MTGTLIDEYAKSLSPAPYDRETVADRHEKMEQALATCSLRADYWFESGSWTHGTALRGYSDVDYMAWAFGPRPARPSSALATMKAALVNSHWAITDLRVSSPTVKVQFLSPPHFEVVPAWHCKTVGDDDVFWIPGPGDQWTESAPRAHLQFVNDQNDRLHKRVKPLARLLKAWKVNTGAPVSSFYLEMRTAEYAGDWETIHYALDLMWLMQNLIGHEVRSMNDPTGLVTRIHAVSSEENRHTTLRLLKEAEKNLSKAYDLDGKPGNAYDYWDRMTDVFGTSFPYPTW